MENINKLLESIVSLVELILNNSTVDKVSKIIGLIVVLISIHPINL